MTSISGGRAPDDDVVELPAIDLDTALDPEPHGDHSDRDDLPHDGTTPLARATRRRWLVLPLLLVVGVLLGAYIANVRADTRAAGTVSLELGGYDVREWGYTPDQPLRAGVHLLNTGTREVRVVGLSVPGLKDEELTPRSRATDGIAIPPGEWVTIPVSRDPDCGEPGSLAGGMSVPDSSSVVVEVELDGRRAEVTAHGPSAASTIFGQALTNACNTSVEDYLYVQVDAVEVEEPRDGSLVMHTMASADARLRGEITSITTTAPGLSARATSLPISTTVAPGPLTLVWTIDDCAAAKLLADVTLQVEVTTADGEARTTSSWLGTQALLAIGGLIAQTCDPGADGS